MEITRQISSTEAVELRVMFETKRTLREQGSKKAVETITLTDARENLSAGQSALSLMFIA